MEQRTPKYRAIYNQLKNEILSGRYGAKSHFPSEVALSRRFKTGRSTVKRALDELRHLGFICSHQGRGTFITSQGASRRIGLLVPGVAYSEHFSNVVSAISRSAQKAGYLLLFGDMSSPRIVERVRCARKFAAELVKERVAGVIYQPFEFVDDIERCNREIVSVFEAAGIPVVLLDTDIELPPGRSAFDVVGVNNADAGYRLGNHLISVGARKVDFLLRPNSASSGRNRLRGIETAVRAASGKSLRFRTLLAEPDDLAAVRSHLKSGVPDAFVCGGDISAAKFKQTLERAGLRIPRDVLLAGFNDLQIASLLTPPLTTVRQPCEQIGEAAFRRLLARIAEPSLPPCEIFLPATLVVRGSTSKIYSANKSQTRRK